MILPAREAMHVYEIPPRRDHRGVDLISEALPFGRLWYGEPSAIDYAKFYSRSHDAVIRVYDEAGNVIETHQHTGEFKGGAFTFAPENGAPKVTTALPPMRGPAILFKSRQVQFLETITL
jgi:hypothetical protein